ncbi:MAG: hypothetical protein ACSHYB_09285 [Roseibacillus sp.]
MIRPTLLCTFAVSFNCPAALTLVQALDNFDSGPSPLSVSSGSHQQSFQDPSNSIPGAWRNIEVTVTSNPFARTANVGVSSVTGQYFAELGPGLTADLSLTYDANSAGLGGFDLSAGGATSLAFLVADSDANLEISVSVTDINSQVASLQILQASALTNDTLIDFPFSSFTNASATDFSQVDSLQFSFNNGPAGDFSVRMLGTFSAVPEPSLPLFASMTLGIFFFRRNRL